MCIRDRAQVDLKENPQTAGEQGGHKYHTGTGGAQLPSGTYSWEVSQTKMCIRDRSSNEKEAKSIMKPMNNKD